MNNGEFLKQYGNKVRKLRIAKGLYIYELAQRCKLQVSAISAIENGGKNSYLLTIKTIADQLGVEVTELLTP